MTHLYPLQIRHYISTTGETDTGGPYLPTTCETCILHFRSDTSTHYRWDIYRWAIPSDYMWDKYTSLQVRYFYPLQVARLLQPISDCRDVWIKYRHRMFQDVWHFWIVVFCLLLLCTYSGAFNSCVLVCVYACLCVSAHMPACICIGVLLSASLLM